MDSAHRSASFRGSCIVAPRHPKTKLPTSVVERKSFDFSLLNDFGEDGNENTEENKAFHKNTTRGNDGEKKDSNSKVKQKKRPQTTPIKSRISGCNAQRRSTTSHGNSSVSNSSYAENLQTISKGDDQFFLRLQALKMENKRTLEHLKQLYDLDKFNENMGSNNNGNITSAHVDPSMNKNLLKGFGENDTIDNGHSQKTNDSKGDYVIDMDNYAGEKNDDQCSSDESEEDDLDKQLKVAPPDSHINILPNEDTSFRGRSSSYDMIADMWRNFSVDDVVPYDSIRKSFTKSADWSPSVTIPEPFQMTVREERKKKQKNKKIEQIKDELLKKRLEDEVELRKRTVPTPVPASTFLPLYSEFQAEQEKKKEYIKDISKNILKSTEKPFSFLKREEAKSKIKQSHAPKRVKSRNKKLFKANPFPQRLFDLTLADKQAEEEEYRRIKIKLRSEEMLLSSSLPPNMKTRSDHRYYRAGRKINELKSELRKQKENAFQPLIHHDIPDYEEMQKKVELAIEARKDKNTLTVCEPFDLHTANVPSRRTKFKKSFELKGNDDKIRNCRSTSPRISSKSNSVADSPAYKLTESARLRQEHIHNSLVKQRNEENRKRAEERLKQKELMKLQKKVAKKVYAQHPSPYREKESVEKLSSFREADLHRSREYNEFLLSIQKRNKERPLLFERESQTNAKILAQKRYEQILREAGIEDSMIQSINSSDDYQNNEEGSDISYRSPNNESMDGEINSKYGLVNLSGDHELCNDGNNSDSDTQDNYKENNDVANGNDDNPHSISYNNSVELSSNDGSYIES